MQQILNRDNLKELEYLVGNEEYLVHMPKVMPLQPFDEDIIDFLDRLSRNLLKDKEAKQYPDIVTFAFWIRRANILNLKKRFVKDEKGLIRMGRGMLFHIAPSNVPVNYAYSLVTGLLTGNANVVRVPSKDFRQVDLISRAMQNVLEQTAHGVADRICLVRYHHQAEITAELSAWVDGRIIWGGDATIKEIRKCEIPTRAVEVAFADRYSLAVINSDAYMDTEDKSKIAKAFYNDTYLTDQNACTSPRAVIWRGSQNEPAKKIFWQQLHEMLKEKYDLQEKQVVDKYTNLYMLSAIQDLQYNVVPMEDNYIVRIRTDRLSADLMEYKGNSGFFFEYDCMEWEEMLDIFHAAACQTVSYYGNIDGLEELLKTGVKGVDRIVPMGKTMDFDLIWDGYNLYECLTRNVRNKVS